MIYLLVSDDSLFHRMVSETFLQEEEVWSWAGRKKNGEAWPGPGAAFYGDPGDPETFRGVVPPGGEGPRHHHQRRAGPPRAREPAQGLVGGHGGRPAGGGDRAPADAGTRAGGAGRAGRGGERRPRPPARS